MNFLDKNNDGKVTEEDFVQLIHNLKLGAIGDYAIKKVFRKLDKNKNGELDASEVAAAVDIVKDLVAKMLKSKS